MISKKQKQIYDFIVSYAEENGIAPSLEEIAQHFSEFLAYPSSAYYHVKKLEEEGYLERESNRPRSIGIHANREIKSPFLQKAGLDSIKIPDLGAANAGLPTLLAEENIEGYLKVSRSSINQKEKVFALRVEGDSMNKARINGKSIKEDDFVLIDPEYKNPQNGDYVLSVIDGCANIKKFQKNAKTGEIRLISESSNSIHKPIFISSDDTVMINGKVISVIKK